MRSISRIVGVSINIVSKLLVEVGKACAAYLDETVRNVGMRHFTCLTNGFSKKQENHLQMLGQYFVHYNFVRIHKTLCMPPAMAADVSETLHDTEWIVSPIDARAPVPKKRGPYKKRQPENSN